MISRKILLKRLKHYYREFKFHFIQKICKHHWIGTEYDNHHTDFLCSKCCKTNRGKNHDE